jgi:hypothetical protein
MRAASKRDVCLVTWRDLPAAALKDVFPEAARADDLDGDLGRGVKAFKFADAAGNTSYFCVDEVRGIAYSHGSHLLPSQTMLMLKRSGAQAFV